jgi:hypothetical protein
VQHWEDNSMDLIQRLSQFWVEMITAMDPGLKVYLVRISLGLLTMQILAMQFVRRSGVDELTPARQIFVLTLGVLVVMVLPVQIILDYPMALQVTGVSLGLWIDVLFPYFLPFNLIRTYGRQILVRRVLYTLIGVGVLFQLAVSEV